MAKKSPIKKTGTNSSGQASAPNKFGSWNELLVERKPTDNTEEITAENSYKNPASMSRSRGKVHAGPASITGDRKKCNITVKKRSLESLMKNEFKIIIGLRSAPYPSGVSDGQPRP